jgi:predicted ATP-grasp superfamily ATP-dependent carboligase
MRAGVRACGGGYTSTFVETVERRKSKMQLADSCGRSATAAWSRSISNTDARDGRYKILDVTARTWTWNALGSIACSLSKAIRFRSEHNWLSSLCRIAKSIFL